MGQTLLQRLRDMLAGECDPDNATTLTEAVAELRRRAAVPRVEAPPAAPPAKKPRKPNRPPCRPRGRHGTKAAMHATWITCWRLRHAGLSLQTIGDRVGRHHSTVLHNIRAVEADPVLLERARSEPA